VLNLSSAAQRSLAAIWFAASAALASFLFFLKLSMALHGVILYIVLPSLAAGIAGSIWGGAILDPSRTKSYGQSVLRGLGVSAGAYVIFGLLFGCVSPWLEGTWSLVQAWNVFLFTLVLGILLGGPLAAAAGIFAGITLFRFGRHLFAESGGRPSETTV
jgi:hypothetical protein